MKMENRKKQTVQVTQQDQNYQDKPIKQELHSKIRTVAEDDNYIKAVSKMKKIQNRAYKNKLYE